MQKARSFQESSWSLLTEIAGGPEGPGSAYPQACAWPRARRHKHRRPQRSLARKLSAGAFFAAGFDVPTFRNKGLHNLLRITKGMGCEFAPLPAKESLAT